MTKNIPVIKNKQNTKKQWNLVHDFERQQKKLFLRKLTTNKSLKIFRDLYQFGQDINGSAYYRKLDPIKVEVLSNVHFMFMKVKS